MSIVKQIIINYIVKNSPVREMMKPKMIRQEQSSRREGEFERERFKK